jgi:3'-phosphoadenosine 5'-phosphosulfate sulfotransferase (PAPS reductase)/FAD synthetase
MTRHILGISGGKDSAALAIYMKGKVEGMEYFFTDTGHELPEVYEYLAKLEGFLGQEIVRLEAERDFDFYLKLYDNYLPSNRARWCTRMLKIKPFENWIGTDDTVSYVGIRADEDRSGYVSTKDNIKPVFPFKEDGIVKADVFRMLEDSGIGVPSYYEWRTRSGCYFCFFQRKKEWLNLRERHPKLYEKAKTFEKFDIDDESGFTWIDGESLDDLEQPARMKQINERHEAAMASELKRNKNQTLADVFGDVLDDDDDSQQCFECSL